MSVPILFKPVYGISVIYVTDIVRELNFQIIEKVLSFITTEREPRLR